MLAFQSGAVEKAADEGLKIAASAHQAGMEAMQERGRGRVVLGISPSGLSPLWRVSGSPSGGWKEERAEEVWG